MPASMQDTDKIWDEDPIIVEEIDIELSRLNNKWMLDRGNATLGIQTVNQHRVWREIMVDWSGWGGPLAEGSREGEKQGSGPSESSKSWRVISSQSGGQACGQKHVKVLWLPIRKAERQLDLSKLAREAQWVRWTSLPHWQAGLFFEDSKGRSTINLEFF